MRTALLRGLGLLFAALCAFFAYYTARLIYINVFGPSLTGHRQNGMYVGAIAFPLAVISFAWVSLRLFRLASGKNSAPSSQETTD